MADAPASTTSARHGSKPKGPKLANSVTLVATSTFALSVLLQLADHLDYLHARIPTVRQQLLVVAMMLGKQGETLIVSCVLAALFIPLSRAAVGRWAYVTLLTLSQVFVALSHVYFGMFFEYFRLGRSGEWKASEWQLWIDSILRDLSLSGWSALIALPLLAAIWGWRLLPAQRRQPPVWPLRFRQRRALVCIGVVALVGATLAIDLPSPQASLVRHPFVALVQWSDGTERAGRLLVSETAYHGALIRGLPTEEPEVDRALAHYLDRAGKAGPQVNVVLLVLESVGSANLLDDRGHPMSDAMPFLASLASQAVVFPNVYTVFPSTARAHIYLHTGGLVPTLSGVYRATQFRYQGEQLPIFFGRHGYTSAMLSSQFLAFENLGKWYDEAGYDKIWAPAQGSAASKDHELDSWGIDETVVVDDALAWIGETSAPSLLTFLSSGTHHPYSVPKGYDGPFPDDDRLGRYRNALRFADAWFERLWRGLAQSDAPQDTVFAIVGDHGEAFGRRHGTNYLHRNFIYEENVRSFLLLLDPRLSTGPVVSNKVASLGDVFPTIAHLAVGATPSTTGRSLLMRPFAEQAVFFHKNTAPLRWGLRDGQWKFISTQNDDSEVELYDLSEDPTEQRNIAADHPDQVADYRAQMAAWFLHAERAFGRRRDNLHSEAPALLVGRKEGGRFSPSSVFGPHDSILARLEGDPTSTSKASLRWQGPAGLVRTIDLKPLDSKRTVTIALTPEPSHALGRWRVVLMSGDTERASGSFAVSSRITDISD